MYVGGMMLKPHAYEFLPAIPINCRPGSNFLNKVRMSLFGGRNVPPDWKKVTYCICIKLEWTNPNCPNMFKRACKVGCVSQWDNRSKWDKINSQIISLISMLY